MIFPYISLMVREDSVKIFHNSYRVFFHSIRGQSVPVLAFTTRISNLSCGSAHLLTIKRMFGYNCNKIIVTYCKFGNFREDFYFRETLHMGSFVKINPREIVVNFSHH